MPYPPLVQYATIGEYRSRWIRCYCAGPIMTFDGIAVRFRRDKFPHYFFESSGRDGNKDQFSPKRAERIDWIKATLEDAKAELFVGWDKGKRRYDLSRRVAVVMGDYVVIIALTGEATADFVSAYVADTPASAGRRSTLEMIRRGPAWKREGDR